jgi:hypothetical protein
VLHDELSILLDARNTVHMRVMNLLDVLDLLGVMDLLGR